MSSNPEPRSLAVSIRLDGPTAATRAILTQIVQANTLQIAALPLPAPLPSVAHDDWHTSPTDMPSSDTPSEELHGLRFQAGPVCAYVAQQAGQPAQVEFEVFAQEPCTLERVLHELPALMAILHDPGFQTAVGWTMPLSAGEAC